MGRSFELPLNPTFRGTLAGDGRPGPIEERIGRRLVRLIDPESAEGIELLGSGSVELVGPGGEAFGPVRVDAAYGQLIERLERRIAAAASATDRADLEEGLGRLKHWTERLSASR